MRTTIFILAFASCIFPVAAQAMTVVEYRSALREIRDAAASMEQPTSRHAVELADAIEAALPADESVKIGESGLPVTDEQLTQLAEDLRDADTSAEVRTAAEGARARAEALLDALGTGQLLDVPEDREALEAILVDEQTGAGKLGDLLLEWAERLVEWLSELLSGLGGLAPSGPAPDLSAAWPYILGVAAAIGAGLIVFAVMQLVAWRRRQKPQPVEEGEPPVISAAQDLPPDVVGYAERLAASGRFREAVRALFGGAARTLVELGIISRTKTRTNGELLCDVRATAPSLVAELGDLARIFESAWYGFQDPGASGVERARAQYAAVIEGARLLKESGS